MEQLMPMHHFESYVPVAGVDVQVRTEYVGSPHADDEMYVPFPDESPEHMWKLTFDLANKSCTHLQLKSCELFAVENGGSLFQVEYMDNEECLFPLLAKGEKQTFDCYAMVARPMAALMGRFTFIDSESQEHEVLMPSVFLDIPEAKPVVH